MDDESTFHRFVSDLQAGDEDAAERLFRDYFTRLVRFAQAKIAPRYHAKTDPEGIAASVMRTFFRRHQAGEFAELGDAQELWQLLAHIAACKCCNRVRKFRPAPAEDRERALPEEEIAAEMQDSGEVMVADLIEAALVGFSDVERRIVEMTLAESDVNEIAAQFKLSARTVLRVRKRFRSRLAKMLGESQA